MSDDIPAPAVAPPGIAPAREQPSPILWHHGQPWSPEMAAKALAEFDTDKDKVAAAIGGDIKYQQERRNYWMLARGLQPEAVPALPVDAGGVAEQMNEREQQIHEAIVDVWSRHINVTPEVKAELDAGVATKEWIDHGRREIQRMKRDDGFRQRLLAGDMDAMDRWSRMHKFGYGMREVSLASTK